MGLLECVGKVLHIEAKQGGGCPITVMGQLFAASLLPESWGWFWIVALRVVPCEGCVSRERALIMVVIVVVIMMVIVPMCSVKGLGHWRRVLAREVGFVAE